MSSSNCGQPRERGRQIGEIISYRHAELGSKNSESMAECYCVELAPMIIILIRRSIEGDGKRIPCK
jgi:hypothetical protein